MLILPPFQGEGHGAQLLEAVHRFYCGLPKVQDITGEKTLFLLRDAVASYTTPPHTHTLILLFLSFPFLRILKTIDSNVYRCLLSAEDPSESYVKLRDFVLSKLCQSLLAFAADKLPLGFSDEMVKEAQDKLKINKVWYRSALNYHLMSALVLALQIYKEIVFFYPRNTRDACMRSCA